MSFGQHMLFAVGGAVAAGVAAMLANNGKLHEAAVTVTAKAIEVGDVLNAESQAILDDANDVLAEQRYQAKIDAAVQAELDELIPDIRARVIAKLDKEGVAE